MINLNIFKSRTVWTIVVMFLINGVQGIHSMVPAEWLPFIDGILSMLAIYFRVAPAQTFGGTK